MISAIVLAAGESRRMGRQKVLLPFGDSTVLEEIVTAIEQSAVGSGVVVTGHQPEGVAELLAGRSLRAVHNAAYSGGMLSSIRAGLRALPDEARGVMLFLGDQPQVDVTLIDHLCDTFRPGSGQLCVPTFNGRRGHPLLFDRGYENEIFNDFDEVGLRGLLQRYEAKVCPVPWQNEGVLVDLDTPEDYARALELSPVSGKGIAGTGE